jgi:repressor LexA
MQSLHPLQEELHNLAKNRKINGMSLRQIGALVGESSPQKVKHHLVQLSRYGMIRFDSSSRVVLPITSETETFASIRILGAADCGSATAIAEQRVLGYLKISRRLLKTDASDKYLFALRALGNSMNRADIGGTNIEEGDYVIVDGHKSNPLNGDFVVSIIDGMANIKRFVRMSDEQIALVSESTEEIVPIYVHADDDYQYSGKVVQVIKRPRNV